MFAQSDCYSAKFNTAIYGRNNYLLPLMAGVAGIHDCWQHYSHMHTDLRK